MTMLWQASATAWTRASGRRAALVLINEMNPGIKHLIAAKAMIGGYVYVYVYVRNP